jgi:hypothetical protein
VEVAWCLLGALVLAVATVAALRQNKAIAQAAAVKEAAAAAAGTLSAKPSASVISISTSMSLREHKPNSYRFDGNAYPQFSISYADVNGSLSEREIYVDTWHRISSVSCSSGKLKSKSVLSTISAAMRRR